MRGFWSGVRGSGSGGVGGRDSSGGGKGRDVRRFNVRVGEQFPELPRSVEYSGDFERWFAGTSFLVYVGLLRSHVVFEMFLAVRNLPPVGFESPIV